MAGTPTPTTGKSRMLKRSRMARGRNGPGTRRPLTPLHFLRLARTMTQAQLAEIVGINKSTIQRYELGRDVPPPDQRVRIALVLGTMPECLWPPGEVLDRLLAS